jgi:ABC-type polysaccharide/polyol phosphate export permease
MDRIAIAWRDLVDCFARLPFAARLALDDIEGRYRRTVLGPLWLTLGQAATIFAMVLVFSGLFNQDPHKFALYLAAGLAIWNFIAGIVTGSPTIWIASKGYLESYDIPWTFYILRYTLTAVFIFCHHIITYILLKLWLNPEISWSYLWVIPGFAVLILAAFSTAWVLSMLGARYRDSGPAIGVVMSFLFLITPVFWGREGLPTRQYIVDYNPFYHFLELVRAPLMGSVPTAANWAWSIGCTTALFVIGLLSFARTRHRLYHWI